MFSELLASFFYVISQLSFSLYQHFRKPSATSSEEKTKRRRRRRRGGRRRRRRRRDVQMAPLPEGVISNILSRLPVKSLVQCRSVCKAWDTLIRDPYFISENLHLHAKQNQISGCLLLLYCSRNTSKNVISVLYQGTHMLSNLEIPSVVDSDDLRYVGSQNGLLCVTNDDAFASTIILWNPAIRQYRVLPDCLIDSEGAQKAQVCGVVHGFGYHPTIDDYKVVRIVFYYVFGKPGCTRAEVYSLKTDRWREIDIIYSHDYDSSCTAINGKLYWLACGSREDCELIISFNMSNELFREFQLPDFSFVQDEMRTQLVALNDSLHLVADNFGRREKELYLWRLNEQDGEVIWSKELTLKGLLSGLTRPLGCSPYGEIYMENRKGDLVVVCDPDSGRRSKRFRIRSVRYTLEVHFYVESLVSIK